MLHIVVVVVVVETEQLLEKLKSDTAAPRICINTRRRFPSFVTLVAEHSNWTHTHTLSGQNEGYTGRLLLVAAAAGRGRSLRRLPAKPGVPSGHHQPGQSSEPRRHVQEQFPDRERNQPGAGGLPEGRPRRWASVRCPRRRVLRRPRRTSHQHRLRVRRKRLPAERQPSAHAAADPCRDTGIPEALGHTSQHARTSVPVVVIYIYIYSLCLPLPAVTPEQ